MEPENFPTKVSFTKADVVRMKSQRPLNSDKWIKVCIASVKAMTAPTKGKGPGEDIILLARMDILDPAKGDVKLQGAPPIFHRMTLPLAHPSYESHIPPALSAVFWKEFCRAFLSERHPQAPKKDGTKYKFKGKLVERVDLPRIEEELDTALLQEATDRCADKGADLNRLVAYAKTKISPEGFINLKNLCADMPPDAKLASAEELFAVEKTIEEKKKVKK